MIAGIALEVGAINSEVAVRQAAAERFDGKTDTVEAEFFYGVGEDGFVVGADDAAEVDLLAGQDGGGEVTEDGAWNQAAALGDLVDIHSFPKHFQGFEDGCCKSVASRFWFFGPDRSEGGENLSWVFFEVSGHFGGEEMGEIRGFAFSDTADAGEFVRGNWVFAGDVAQGGVGEDDVGGDIAFVGEVLAEIAEALEEEFVTFDLALAMTRLILCLDAAGEGDFFAGAKSVAALRSELKGVEAFWILLEVTDADEFAADGAPFRAGVFLADAVSGE